MNRRNAANAYIARFEDVGHCLAHDPGSQDLINAIENRFGVILTNDEAQALRTPAQLIDLILAKVESGEPTGCMSQQGFHLIRRAAQRSFGLPRQSISPNSKLEEIVPRKLRYARWKGFGTNIGAVSWPELKRSRVTFVVLALLAVAVFVFTSAQLAETGLANVLLSLTLA